MAKKKSSKKNRVEMPKLRDLESRGAEQVRGGHVSGAACLRLGIPNDLEEESSGG